MSSYPNATYVPSTEAAPYADDTRLDCYSYVTAPILTNYTGNGTISLACEDVIEQYGILLSDFLDWNPSLDESSPCTMMNYTQYCVQTYPRLSEKIVLSCTEFDEAEPGYDCIGFTSSRGLDPDQFALWNPEVGSDCSDFEVGTQYCVAVLHYKQSGTVFAIFTLKDFGANKWT